MDPGLSSFCSLFSPERSRRAECRLPLSDLRSPLSDLRCSPAEPPFSNFDFPISNFLLLRSPLATAFLPFNPPFRPFPAEYLTTWYRPCYSSVCLLALSPEVSAADPPTCRLSPIFRILFHLPYTLSPLFVTLTKTAGVYPDSSQIGTGHAPLPIFNHLRITSNSTIR